MSEAQTDLLPTVDIKAKKVPLLWIELAKRSNSP
jgi:hypothetical protein